MATMSSAPASSSFPTSSAGGPVVETVHACARHPLLRGDRGCASCGNALCSACARSLPHRHCPDCRTKQDKPAHVVDAGWRITLLIDAVLLSLRAIPRRVPALAGILAVSLFGPLGLYLLADPSTPDWKDAAALAGLFAFAAFGLGCFLQPLLVLPLLTRTSKTRALVGAVLGCAVAFVPLVVVIAAAAGLMAAGVDDEAVGNLAGLAFCAVAAVTLPIGLVWQGRAVMDRPPTLRGSLGAVVAHFCVAGLWGFVLSFAWFPIAAIVAVGVFASPVVAGVLGTVCGVVLWLGLLWGMGSFAAASARYSDDLERL